MLNVGILISGRGSNMEAILRAMQDGGMRARCAVVISNRSDAPGLAVAEGMGVETRVVPSKGFAVERRKKTVSRRGNLVLEETEIVPGADRWEYDKRIASVLQECGVAPGDGLVCLAGFMRLVGSRFVNLYRNRILNIHPALLPSFPGLDAQRQAVEYGVRHSGCTVHIVDDGMDTGPILLQDVVPVHADDTAESLSARILVREHLLYPRAVRLFAEDRVRVRGRRALILDPRD